MSWWKPIRLGEYELVPMRWFVFGIRERPFGSKPHSEVREEYFFDLALPSYKYDLCDYNRRYRWQRLHVYWLGCSGFGTYWEPLLDHECRR